MLSGKKAVYYLCDDRGRPGLVSRTVWEILNEENPMVPAGIVFNGREVMIRRDERDNEYYFVPTEVPVCWDYPKYLPEMNRCFADCDMAGMVTWHEGASAPPKVLTVHSIGDVQTGVYGPAAPGYMRNLLLAIEKNRAAADAVAGGIEAIVCHDKMKGCYKDLARALGEKYHVPVLKHQRLRNPEEAGLSGQR